MFLLFLLKDTVPDIETFRFLRVGKFEDLGYDAQDGLQCQCASLQITERPGAGQQGQEGEVRRAWTNFKVPVGSTCGRLLETGWFCSWAEQ